MTEQAEMGSTGERLVVGVAADGELKALLPEALAGRHSLDAATIVVGPIVGGRTSMLNALGGAVVADGRLQELLDDPAVETIDYAGGDEVWVAYTGERRRIRDRAVAESLLSSVCGAGHG